ncbi:MAG TPA: hypothetical protein VMV16_07220 [Solirubrobacteraceae bacterium]|nr:hypothetical protein [Solirubrobacteraceae bacterium]
MRLRRDPLSPGELGLRVLAVVFFLLAAFGSPLGLRIVSALVSVACFTAANVVAYRRRNRT